MSRAAAAPSYPQTRARFIREHVDVYLKDRTAVNCHHGITDVIVPALGDREFATITRRDAQTLHASLSAPTLARAARFGLREAGAGHVEELAAVEQWLAGPAP